MITLPRFVGRIWNAAKTLLSNPEDVRVIHVPVRTAGVRVDHDTALTTSAYWRAIVYISGQIAGLPWDVIRETPDRTIKLPQHGVWKLLKTRASQEIGPFTWRETMVAWALSWGNGYAEIERDNADRPLALHPISPDRVEPMRGKIENGEFVRDIKGEIFYQVWNYSGEVSYLPSGNIFHLHGLGFDGLVGYSVLSLAARSLGISIAAEKYGSDFFGNALVSTGGLKHPKALSDAAHDRLKKWIKAVTSNRWEPPIFEEGMEWVPMSVPPEQAQMLESRQFQICDVARWFGLPPHKLADLSRATFSNIESQSREVVNDCFMPWIHRL